jgi:hypothetical protein
MVQAVMSERDPRLEPFERLIGAWDTVARHPMLDADVPGHQTYEWLEGGRFVVLRSHHEHELFPDAICVIGLTEATDELVMEYFDSRGVRRTYNTSLEDGVHRIWRDAPGFDQRYEATIADEYVGLHQLAEQPGEWKDDLKVTYRRRS